eukprot:CAMPEP_0170348796 /NCGR_PEP_ID=MMETSP0116_2-20130129/75680_1 /TAXON_ID=400756 /ORGANISM="Durinskia baltica, Strain CSIRO CS-38" /LENGTH=68 /DNA_ID=CAMNT_0010602663 /DNA_START=75 /DNA_END=278 /DNA_ORIENTATION=-
MAPATPRIAHRAPRATPPSTPMRRHAPATKVGAMKVTEDDVVAAVDSLYQDELRPYGRLLILRLAERL